MSKKSRWFLSLACAATLVAGARFIPSLGVGDGAADFAAGLSAAMMLGVLLTWTDPRAE